MNKTRPFIRTGRGNAFVASTSARARQRGYTLIEIIVAFAILALGLTLLLGTLSGATRQVRAAGDAGRAALHAQSLLDEFGNLPQPQHRDGELEQGRYRWRLDVEPWQDPSPTVAAPPVDPNAARLMHLRLQVEWGDGSPVQRVEATSLRLVLPQAEGISAP
jgi:general secretion pathway protein I